MAPKVKAPPAPVKTKYASLQEEFAALELEAPKVYEKGNKAAGSRVRKHLSNIKKLCTEVRAETLELVGAP